MYRIILAAAVMFLITAPAVTARAGAPLELYLFGSSTCGECLEVKERLLKPLEDEYGDRLKVTFYDTEEPASIELADRLEKQYGMTETSPQELFFPDTVLFGYTTIMRVGRQMIIERLNDPNSKRTIIVEGEERAIDEVLRERFDTFTFGAIVAAAMVDAVNPCAIATMIFLVSFLATQKRRRIEVLVTGMSFTFAVFLTYLLLGLGAFKVITMLDQYYWVSRGIKWTAVAFAGVIGVISLADGLRFKKSGNTKDITLQLPKSVKMRIHKIITTKMTGSRLYIGAFIAGFLVTLLEAICTGQVYLPTIVLMTRHGTGELQLLGWFYLILYNFIFVLPLIIVMIAAYHGMKWNTLSKLMQKNMTAVKILLGVVLLGLALYLALA